MTEDTSRRTNSMPAIIWCFAKCELDFARRELRVAGAVRAIEAKPLALLAALLARAGEVVTKDELMEAVWPNLNVVEGSLPTAISKLRQVLGDQGRAIIESVHGVGYRLGVPVTQRAGAPLPRVTIGLRAGDTVSGRQQWQLERALGPGPNPEIWLARHTKTAECRVFKFADTAGRLEALKREAAISRVLTASLEERRDFIRVLEWNFETSPYFIESAYGGPNLPGWADAAGGVAGLALDVRLAIVAQVARCVAAAHGVGVLHGDIKPSNILVGEDEADAPFARLVDFGSGRLTEAAESLHITGVGLARLAPTDQADHAGTFIYTAPEVLGGGPATTAADIFALGIVLFQMVVGNLERPLAAGWEASVADPLLRADIAATAAGDPERRLASAALLAERLENLTARRDDAARHAAQAATAEQLAARLARIRLRRPWLGVAFAAMAIAALGIGAAGLRAARRGDEARRQAAIAGAINRFLTDDLLGRGDPAKSGQADETLMQAASRAEDVVDARFSAEKLVAASVHLTLAHAFDRRSAYAAGRAAYARAIADFEQAPGASTADIAITRLQWACMEALSFEPGSIAKAKQLVALAQASTGQLGARAAEAAIWTDTAQGLMGMTGGDVAQSHGLFKAAADLADTMPTTFSEEQRLALRRREATADMRLGNWTQADAVLTSLLPKEIALHGADHSETLMVRLNLAQLEMERGKAKAAVQDFSSLYPEFVSVYGPTHRMTLGLLAGRAESLGQLERYDDSVRDDMVVYHAAAANEGENSYAALVTLTDAASSQCRAGHVAEGLAAARHAYDVAAASRGDSNTQTQVMAANVAFCLILGKDYTQAASFLGKVDPKAVGQLAGDPTYQADIDLMHAAIAAGEGDSNKVPSLLRYPRQVFAQADADPFMKRWTAELGASLREPALKE